MSADINMFLLVVASGNFPVNSVGRALGTECPWLKCPKLRLIHTHTHTLCFLLCSISVWF